MSVVKLNFQLIVKNILEHETDMYMFCLIYVYKTFNT